jgi:hypothetical protein
VCPSELIMSTTNSTTKTMHKLVDDPLQITLLL